MKRKQFSVEVTPPYSGWFKVHYAGPDKVERRYFDADAKKWRKGPYPINTNEEAKGVRGNKNNSWSYYFQM